MTLWIGYARSGQEFAVRDAIRALGITATVPRMVEAKRQGKRRWPDAIVTPALPNYIFIEVSNEDWHKLRGIKFLAATMVQVSETEANSRQTGPRAYVAEIEDRFEVRHAAIQAAIAAGQKVEEYKPDEAVEIIAGKLAGTLARFRRVVEQGQIPMLEVELEGRMFGKSVRMKVDPLDARKAVSQPIV